MKRLKKWFCKWFDYVDYINQCPVCKAYNSHSVDCPNIDLEEAKKQLKQYHQLWLTREMWTRKRSDMWRNEANKWRGKFFEVKHENNQLRKNFVTTQSNKE